MGVSLKDIALQLNLSKTTVSWVLSGQGDKKGISPETQHRVVSCARELAYEPNLLARSLNSGMSKTIGLILPSICDGFYSHVAQGIETEAEQAGYSLMIAGSNSEIERETAMLRLFLSKKADGIIIAPTKISEREILRTVDRDYPVVLLGRYFSEIPVDRIVINDEESSYRLVHRLIVEGCRKIAILAIDPHLPTMEMRRKGYADALADAQLGLDPALYAEIPHVADYREHVVRALDRIFESTPDVDGFFFTTHILATEALRYFHDHGIDSDRLGLACMHEDPLFRVLAPRMNIARYPAEAIGRHAVRMILDRIARKAEAAAPAPEAKVLACELDFQSA